MVRKPEATEEPGCIYDCTAVKRLEGTLKSRKQQLRLQGRPKVGENVQPHGHLKNGKMVEKWPEQIFEFSMFRCSSTNLIGHLFGIYSPFSAGNSNRLSNSNRPKPPQTSDFPHNPRIATNPPTLPLTCYWMHWESPLSHWRHSPEFPRSKSPRIPGRIEGERISPNQPLSASRLLSNPSRPHMIAKLRPAPLHCGTEQLHCLFHLSICPGVRKEGTQLHSRRHNLCIHSRILKDWELFRQPLPLRQRT